MKKLLILSLILLNVSLAQANKCNEMTIARATWGLSEDDVKDKVKKHCGANSSGIIRGRCDVMPLVGSDKPEYYPVLILGEPKDQTPPYNLVINWYCGDNINDQNRTEIEGRDTGYLGCFCNKNAVKLPN